MRVRALLVVVLLVSLPAVAACGGSDEDSVSQEELEAATDEAAKEAREEALEEETLDELQDEVKELRETEEGNDSEDGESPDVPSTGGTAPAAPAGGVPSSAESCGSGVYAESGTTSCAFALNVASDYFSSASNTFESFSPATGEVYTMTCSGSPVAVCRGGNNAAVYIP